MAHTIAIVQYVSSHTMRHRLSNLFSTITHKLYDAANEIQFFKALSELNYSAVIILIDVDSFQDNGARILTKIRRMDRYSPIIVISSITKKSFYVESMLRGATDFVLKPFDNHLLLMKVVEHLRVKEDDSLLEIITFDLATYLKGEIRKAEKGHYALSLMFLTYFCDGSDEANKIGKHNTYNLVYKAIKALFWDTDIFIRFGTNYYIGVFPFCDEANTQIISRKITERFLKLQSENIELSKFKMITIFNTFPLEAKNPNDMLQLLIERVRQQLPNEEINPIK